MEALSIYEESYKQIRQLLKQNTTGALNVDYTKLDKKTAEELRKKIDEVLMCRNKEVLIMIANRPMQKM